MATYFVTGAAGFIASKLVHRLLKEGHKVIGIDNFLTGLKKNIPDDLIFIEGDISDKKTLDSIPNLKIDAVMHLAAQSSGEISFDKPEYDVMTNALGTLNLLNFSIERGIKRFIYASTMSIYGDVDDKPIKEIDCKNPKSYYGITKLAAENYVNAFSDRLDVTSFRLFNVYGEGQNMSNIKQGMVSIYLSYFMKGEPVLVKGHKDRFRDLTHIDDILDVWVQSIEHSKSYGKSYNLATGEKTTVEQLLKVLAKEWGDEQYPINYASYGTPGDTFGTYADISKLRDDFSWTPKITLGEGIKKFINWVKSEQ